MPVVNELPTQGGGKIEIIQGTTRNGAGSVTLSYPTGFTMDNTAILNIEVYYGGHWETYAFGRFNSASQIPNPSRFFASLEEDGVNVQCEMSTNTYYYNKPVRVTLYKFQ